MSDTSKFWNKIAQKYAKTPVRDQEGYQAKLDHTQTFFTAETRLFEYGCGTGTTALHHAPQVKEVLATDISEEMLAIARDKKAAADINNVRFENWNIETDPVTKNDFDTVMAHSVLHLVDDLPAVLQKTRDLLKPDGVFISSTICLGEWNPLFRPLFVIMKLFGKAPATVSFFKKEDIIEAIETAGFEILKLPKKPWGAALFIAARKI